MTELSAPRQSTIKRLYALASNRCAFPKCSVPIVQDAVLLGKVCHIKGSRPTAKRYDSTQSDEDRHAIGNLIILCSNHHDVIDTDEESYSVERLVRMKQQHEARATSCSDDEAERAATIILSGALTIQSVISTNQSGGISANVVTVNLAHDGNARRIDAIDKLWKTMLNGEKQLTDITLAESILTRDEINGYFVSDGWSGTFTSINDYENNMAFMHKMKAAGYWDADELQIRVPEAAWTAFATHRAMLGRLAALYGFSFQRRKYQDWRKDDLFAGHAVGLLGRAIFDEAAGVTFQGVQHLLNYVQFKFRHAVGNL